MSQAKHSWAELSWAKGQSTAMQTDRLPPATHFLKREEKVKENNKKNECYLELVVDATSIMTDLLHFNLLSRAEKGYIYDVYTMYIQCIYILWQQHGHNFWLSLCVCPINFACFVLFPNPVSNQFALRPKVCYEIISTTAIGNSFHDCPLYFFLSVNRKFSCKLLCRVSSRRAQIKSFLYLLLIKKRKGSPKKVLAWQLWAWE